LKKIFDWVLGLFKKPEEEMNIDFKMWPFPVPSEDFEPRPKKVIVPKATTRKKPAAKKPAAKKKVAAKKTTKKAK